MNIVCSSIIFSLNFNSKTKSPNKVCPQPNTIEKKVNNIFFFEVNMFMIR